MRAKRRRRLSFELWNIGRAKKRNERNAAFIKLSADVFLFSFLDFIPHQFPSVAFAPTSILFRSSSHPVSRLATREINSYSLFHHRGISLEKRVRDLVFVSGVSNSAIVRSLDLFFSVNESSRAIVGRGSFEYPHGGRLIGALFC